MKKCLLIVNPCSGQKKIHNELVDIIKTLNCHGYETIVSMNLHKGHASVIAKNAHDVDLIICAGGDGTLNQVTTGVIEGNHNIPIGYIPSGSTNDYAHTLRLPMNIHDAVNKIINGSPHHFDVGSFNGNAYFNYIASFGLFSEISYSTPQIAKNNFGHMAYVFNGIADFIAAKTYHVKIKANDKVYEDNYILGMISNTISVAGLMKFDPTDIDLSDGLFEVLLIKEPKDFLECNKLINGLINHNFNHSVFTYFKSKCVEIELDEPLTWSLDGEEMPSGKIVKIENLNKKITIVK
jgi:YegS/Rv2252/BmrU family lipid kinase